MRSKCCTRLSVGYMIYYVQGKERDKSKRAQAIPLLEIEQHDIPKK